MYFRKKFVYLAPEINLQREKELLGPWITKNEGAKFCLPVITKPEHRGLQDIFIACSDGFKGFSVAIEAVYPQTQVRLCLYTWSGIHYVMLAGKSVKPWLQICALLTIR
nr:hypothetical protein [Salmonella enterica subsp. diarizonae]